MSTLTYPTVLTNSGRPVSVPPQRVPAIGQVLVLAAGDWAYTNEPRPMVWRVTGVDVEISRWYDGAWVWVHGVELGPDGEPARRQISGAALLVRCAAIPAGTA